MSGNLALLHLPDDQRLHVQLSTYFYASTLAKLRNHIRDNRAGIVVFELAAPINAPLLYVAMDRRSTYVLGYRHASAKFWWSFKEADKPLPSLPGAASRSMGLTGSYTELGLPASINMRPEILLNLLASHDGRPAPRFCEAIVLLLFLVAEALRFDDVLMECVRYFSFGTAAYTIHPASLATTVRNWAASPQGNRNLLVPYLG